MVAEWYPERMSIGEWRQLERRSAVKHEFIDGYVYAMAGGSQAHNAIAANIIMAIGPILRKGSCIAYTSDMAARVTATRYTYPDVVIACGEQRIAKRDETDVSPTVVFEVLSESTERYDRGLKSSYYRQCQTLEEYALVGTDYQSVEVFRRAAEGWGLFRAYGPGEVVGLESVGVQFSIEDVYADTDVPATLPDGGSTIRAVPPHV